MSIGPTCVQNESIWTVYPCPGPPPELQNSVLLISTVNPAGTPRAIARARIRNCLGEALVSVLGITSQAISFINLAGHAPRLKIQGWPEPGLSISHEDGLSLAAVNLRGKVGADLMQVHDVADWQPVAQDYLGPQTTDHLLATPTLLQPQAFANAWCKHEAQLKCHGLALAEWAVTQPPECLVFELALPSPLVGALALPAYTRRSIF